MPEANSAAIRHLARCQKRARRLLKQGKPLDAVKGFLGEMISGPDTWDWIWLGILHIKDLENPAAEDVEKYLAAFDYVVAEKKNDSRRKTRGK